VLCGGHKTGHRFNAEDTLSAIYIPTQPVHCQEGEPQKLASGCIIELSKQEREMIIMHKILAIRVISFLLLSIGLVFAGSDSPKDSITLQEKTYMKPSQEEIKKKLTPLHDKVTQ
jgi:hypothetical protein